MQIKRPMPVVKYPYAQKNDILYSETISGEISLEKFMPEATNRGAIFILLAYMAIFIP